MIFFRIRGTPKLDGHLNTLFIERQEPGTTSTVLRSNDLFKTVSPIEAFIAGVEDFEVRNEYMFATKRQVFVILIIIIMQLMYDIFAILYINFLVFFHRNCSVPRTPMEPHYSYGCHTIDRHFISPSFPTSYHIRYFVYLFLSAFVFSILFTIGQTRAFLFQGRATTGTTCLCSNWITHLSCS